MSWQPIGDGQVDPLFNPKLVKPEGEEVSPEAAASGFRRYGDVGPVDATSCPYGCKLVFSASLYGRLQPRAHQISYLGVFCPRCGQDVMS